MLDKIKTLRELTGVGILDCKNALKECGGDIEKAVDILRKKGKSVALKKSARTAKDGKVGSYIHLGGKIGVLVEVNCETDFVARTDEFKHFVKDVAMQIAASRPFYVSRDDVPKSEVEREKSILAEQVKGKPAEITEKIVQGRLEKFYSQVCLLDQPFIKDDKITIKEYMVQMIAKTGENIVINRFARFQLGE